MDVPPITVGVDFAASPRNTAACEIHWYAGHAVVERAHTTVDDSALVAARTGRPVSLPLLWPFLAHVVALFPDLLFAGGIAHERWTDAFLGHIGTHFVPGRNLTWFAVFLVALGAYLVVLTRLRSGGRA